MIEFNYNDGGRQSAGFKGKAGDCVCRSISITTGMDYKTVYDALAKGNAAQRASKNGRTRTGVRSAANGINTTRKWFKDYMQSIGFTWTPLMGIGTGCKIHVTKDELPSTGKHVLAVSKHYTALVDGELHDTHDCSRNGTRCVYGYWTFKS